MPISSQDPMLVIQKNNSSNIKSANISTIENMIMVLPLRNMLMALNTQLVKINGIIILNMINPVVLSGVKSVKKQRAQVGSNEFKLAIFPVPKNPIKMRIICGVVKALKCVCFCGSVNCSNNIFVCGKL
jgi:hypothetical protein